MFSVKTSTRKKRLTELSPSIKKKLQRFKMANKDVDKEAEKVKGSLVDVGDLDDEVKETDEDLNSKEMLSAILSKQNDMAGDIKSLINTVAGVQRDVKMLKPLVDKVDDLSEKYQEKKKRLTAFETNMSRSEIICTRTKCLMK